MTVGEMTHEAHALYQRGLKDGKSKEEAEKAV
jgi:hypothetical protein